MNALVKSTASEMAAAAFSSTTDMAYNQTYFDDENDERVEELVSTIVPIFFGLIGITGLLGNILVVVVVLSNQQMRSTTNLLIINLAMADLLFVIFCIPFTAVDYMLAYWPFGTIWCKMVQYLIGKWLQKSVKPLLMFVLFGCVHSSSLHSHGQRLHPCADVIRQISGRLSSNLKYFHQD